MVMTRINQFFKAYIHEGLERMEDPVIMVKQYMRDMKEDIQKLEAQIEKHVALEHSLTQNLQAAKELVERREQQARIALEVENDDLARRALFSKKDTFEQVNRYEEMLEKNRAQIKERKQELEQLQLKYGQLRDRKLELILRVQAVKANQQMKQTKQKYDQKGSQIESEFERIEERIVDLEWKSGSKTAVEVMSGDKAHSEEIEAELTQMKTKIEVR